MNTTLKVTLAESAELVAINKLLDQSLEEYAVNKAALVTMAATFVKQGYKFTVTDELNSAFPFNQIWVSIRHNVYGHQSSELFYAGSEKDLAAMNETVTQLMLAVVVPA
jgi:hypothetical protein